MAKLEDALAKRAELGLGFEACAAPSCLLPLGRDLGMAAVLIAWTGSTAAFVKPSSFSHLNDTRSPAPERGSCAPHSPSESGWG